MEIKALVTDSNSKVRKNLTRSLKELGIKNVAEATDGCQAIEMLQKGKYDIVFAEYNTKTAQGDELVTSIRRTDAKTPIVVMAPQSKQMTELKQCCPTAFELPQHAVHHRTAQEDGRPVRAVDRRLSSADPSANRSAFSSHPRSTRGWLLFLPCDANSTESAALQAWYNCRQKP